MYKKSAFDGHLVFLPAFWAAILDPELKKGLKFDELSIAREQHFKGLLKCMKTPNSTTLLSIIHMHTHILTCTHKHTQTLVCVHVAPTQESHWARLHHKQL